MPLDIPKEDPFIRPKLAVTGDATPETLHIAKSKAMEAFDEVERGFAYIFSQTISPAQGSGYAARRVYGATTAVNVRKQMTAASAEVFFRNFPNDEAEPALKRLLILYPTAAARRNEFAHGMVGGERIDGKFWHFLVPNLWTSRSRRMDLSIGYRYASTEVDKIADKFYWLSGQIFVLYDLLEEIYRSSPKKARERY